VKVPDPRARRVFDELAAEHLGQPGTGRRRMFGRDGLSAGGKFFAFLDRDRLVVKLPPATTEALIAGGEAAVATDVSPTMRKWVTVPLPDDPDRWRRLLAEAREYAGAGQEGAAG
jgi:TfoX/Sxy family transcriptional regulator of competence genes